MILSCRILIASRNTRKFKPVHLSTWPTIKNGRWMGRDLSVERPFYTFSLFTTFQSLSMQFLLENATCLSTLGYEVWHAFLIGVLLEDSGVVQVLPGVVLHLFFGGVFFWVTLFPKELLKGCYKFRIAHRNPNRVQIKMRENRPMCDLWQKWKKLIQRETAVCLCPIMGFVPHF